MIEQGFGGEQAHNPDNIPVDANGRMDMGNIETLSPAHFNPENLGQSGGIGENLGNQKTVKAPLSWERSAIDPETFRPVLEIQPFGSISGAWRKGMVFEQGERSGYNRLLLNSISEFVWGVAEYNVQLKSSGFKLRPNPKFRKLEARDLKPETIKDIENTEDAMIQSMIPLESFNDETGEAEWSWIVDDILTATYNEDRTSLDIPDTISIARHDKGLFTKKALYKKIEGSELNEDVEYPKAEVIKDE